MGRVSVKVELSGFNRWVSDVGRSDEVEALMSGIARDVASQARLTAPYSDITDPEHEHYRDSIHVETVTTKHRTVKRVVADVAHATAVEARTGNMARALKEVRSW